MASRRSRDTMKFDPECTARKLWQSVYVWCRVPARLLAGRGEVSSMVMLSGPCLCPYSRHHNWAGVWLLGAAVVAHVTQVSRCQPSDHHSDRVGGANPPGHMQPLGSHRPPEGDIFQIPGFMKPERFFEEHLRPGLPVLFKGAAKMSPAYDKWDDQYLMAQFGDFMVEVEHGKKENRSHFATEYDFGEFLDEYRTQDIYMVQDAFEEMYDDIGLPRCLHCGGAGDLLNTVVLWMSSGGTKSVLHFDDLENINCLLSGEKEVLLIDREYGDLVEADGWLDSHSTLDVDRVDMYAFPEMRHVPWWRAHLDAGDCLYIPMGWYHHVHSSAGSRNLAMNFWFHQNIYFNHTHCELSGPVNDFSPLSPANFITKDNHELGRYFMFIDLTDLEDITLLDLNEAWAELMEDHEVSEVFDRFDADEDGVLSWPEVQQADMAWMVERFGILDYAEEDGLYPEDYDITGMPAWDVEKRLREEL